MKKRDNSIKIAGLVWVASDLSKTEDLGTFNSSETPANTLIDRLLPLLYRRGGFILAIGRRPAEPRWEEDSSGQRVKRDIRSPDAEAVVEPLFIPKPRGKTLTTNDFKKKLRSEGL